MSNRSSRRTLDPRVVELKTCSMAGIAARLHEAHAAGTLRPVRTAEGLRPAVKALRVPGR